jgi:hypothetical protein
MDLNKFYAWQQEKPETRSMRIEADPFKDVTIWVYDYKLQVGQLVQSVDEIDLEGAKEAKERAQFEALKAKFKEAV